MFLPVGENTVIDGSSRISGLMTASTRCSSRRTSASPTRSPTISPIARSKPTLSVGETVEEDEVRRRRGARPAGRARERRRRSHRRRRRQHDQLRSERLRRLLRGKGNADAGRLRRGDRERAKSYGLVDLDGDEVIDFQEKPDDPKTTLVSIACYAFPAETLPDLSTYLEDGNNPDEPGWFLQWLQKRGAVHAYTFDGAWFDIGTADSYLDAVEYALDGGTLVADDAIVENSDLGDVVHVMSGATVTDSTLERAVVFPNVTITDSEIRNSVIDEGATLEGVDLSGALIGSHTSITEGDDF